MAISGPWLVLIALAVAFVVAQLNFYATYARKHDTGWRPFRRLMLSRPNALERSDMGRITFRRDEDIEVERARKVYLTVFAVVILVGLVLLFSGSLLAAY